MQHVRNIYTLINLFGDTHGLVTSIKYILQVNFYNIKAYNKQNNYFLSSLSTNLPNFLPERPA